MVFLWKVVFSTSAFVKGFDVLSAPLPSWRKLISIDMVSGFGGNSSEMAIPSSHQQLRTRTRRRRIENSL